MARANLRIDQTVAERFLAAQDSRTVRLITVKIVGETIGFDNALDKAGSVEEDFNSLLPSVVSPTEATFYLFNATDNEEGALSWVMVVWIPEECRVRDKMLYSSSREDLKKFLGLGYFRADYAANVVEDLAWAHYLDSVNKDFNVEHLTETERLVLEEKALSINESSSTKATALGVIPFALSPSAEEQLAAFKEGTVNWIEFTIVSEVVEVLRATTVEQGTYAQHLNDDTACFVAAKLKRLDGSDVSLFIYFCPENTPVRMKMTLSSSKASVLAAAAARGVSFDKLLEIRGVDEVDYTIQQEVNPATAENAASLSSSAAATLLHSKPSRPGRGKAKVSKFQAE